MEQFGDLIVKEWVNCTCGGQIWARHCGQCRCHMFGSEAADCGQTRPALSLDPPLGVMSSEVVPVPVGGLWHVFCTSPCWPYPQRDVSWNLRFNKKDDSPFWQLSDWFISLFLVLSFMDTFLWALMGARMGRIGLWCSSEQQKSVWTPPSLIYCPSLRDCSTKRRRGR